MSVNERVLQFEVEGEPVHGVVTSPANPQARLGVVIVVGGPQYRVGSHRQFVLLARHLADRGLPVLRFDVRGMGDSGGALRDFEAIDRDIAAAVGAMQQAMPMLQRVALWGLCDGASAILMYLEQHRDPRIAGVCLANPWVRSDQSLARTQLKHYYLQRLTQPSFWRKVLTGGVGLSALNAWLRSVAQARGWGPTATASQPALGFQQRMHLGWRHFPGPILLLLSGEDYTAKEFIEHTAAHPEWQAALARADLTRHDLPGADHTFSDSAARQQAEQLSARWLGALAAATDTAP